MSTQAGQKRRVLIVEDDPFRCAWFSVKLSDFQRDITCDVAQAIEWLGEREYALIMLDHDLRNEHYFSPSPDDEKTGYAIAAWLASHPDSQMEAEIYIHSLNYLGAQRMIDVLEQVGREARHVPFDALAADLDYNL